MDISLLPFNNLFLLPSPHLRLRHYYMTFKLQICEYRKRVRVKRAFLGLYYSTHVHGLFRPMCKIHVFAILKGNPVIACTIIIRMKFFFRAAVKSKIRPFLKVGTSLRSWTRGVKQSNVFSSDPIEAIYLWRSFSWLPPVKVFEVSHVRIYSLWFNFTAISLPHGHQLAGD